MPTAKKLLENPSLRLTEQVAAARLKRAGVTLGADLGLPKPKASRKGGFSPSLIKEFGRRLTHA
jgi:hypothetical protein